MTNLNQRHPQFTEVAAAYDALMSGVPYKRWVDYIEKLLRRLRASPRTVLDIACGTGNVTFALADRGYQVAGVDISEPMLSVAREKARQQGRDIPFMHGDMRTLSLPDRYDLAVCLYDSINYLLTLEDVTQAFASVHRVLHPGGLYIFDVNTIYALRADLFTQRNLDPGARVRYDWRSKYNHETRICEVVMDFWVRENGETRHFTEVHYERGYFLRELVDALTQVGFRTLAVYEAYTFHEPRLLSDRVYFVARKQRARKESDAGEMVVPCLDGI
ncbi:MAG TPA: class I SAM-dependent methyltransferase [Armatimonadota bacterium]|jgi:ubiquinone/menaquinone biosynthesis C-methylase UbiE|nr:class I SAM-dependent methyltransferase [Armatimonadota bacterium]HOJ20926.1 class I SAM-dependent methyltransferase [Armatimonadota bacterium]HOM82443.1 class I SAM-dependent methyltransferase [Armatimonadota bacterium]HPO72501.1 class I SAM-dependent methyltransferase [Armatimonadota bacterium]HPT97193.1 class I SAM-dependent methyltransferase [Armatimonadota bacterium]